LNVNTTLAYKKVRQAVNEDRLTRILENLLTENYSTSVRLRVTLDQTRSLYRQPQGSLSSQILQEYVHTGRGQRHFEARTKWENGRTDHRAAYCDGTKCAEVTFDPTNVDKPQTIEVSHKFADDMSSNGLTIPFPLLSYFVGSKPLVEALTTGESMPDGDALQRPCDVFLFKAVGVAQRKDDLVYYLDKVTSVPLKVVCYTSSDLRLSNRPLWAWEAIRLENVSGHHVALESIWKRFVVKGAEPAAASKVDYTQTIHVDECTFDQQIAASEFWPIYTPGVRVLDRIDRKSFRVKDESAATVATDPIRVREPSSGRWEMIGAGFLIACVIAAVLVRRGSR